MSDEITNLASSVLTLNPDSGQRPCQGLGLGRWATRLFQYFGQELVDVFNRRLEPRIE